MLAKNSHPSARSTRLKRRSLEPVFDGGMMLCLSDSDDEIDRVKQKLQDIRTIHDIPDILVSDDSFEDFARPASGSASKAGKVVSSSASKSSTPNKLKEKMLSTVIEESKSKDKEIANLKNEIAEYQQKLDYLMTDGGDQDIRNSRIKELSKKNKRLIVTLEKERTTVAALQKKVEDLESRVGEKSGYSESETNNTKLNEQLKSLKEKSAFYSRKLEEERLANHGLKTEIRGLKKILHQEIGDGIQLDKIMKGEICFKGRSEQISILKERVKVLERKLEKGSRGPSNRTIQNVEISSTNETLKKDVTRKKEIESLNSQINSANKHLTDYKRKNDGLIARTRMLETQVKDFKCKIAVLLKKASNDDQLIIALQEELQKVQSKMTDVAEVKKFKRLSGARAVEISSLKDELERNVKGLISTTPTTLNESNSSDKERLRCMIGSLKEEVQKLRAENGAIEAKLAKSLVAQPLKPKMKAPLATTQPIEDLEELVALLKDENDTLKHSITEISEARRLDLELYRSLLDQKRENAEECRS